MKQPGKFLSIVFLIISAQNFAFPQNDEMRQGTGLPMAIGQGSTDRLKTNVYGKITVQGLDTSRPKPVIFVSAFYNGVMVDRRQAYENGSYVIPGVPRENVTMVIEINGVEYGRQLLQSSIIGTVQQDFTVNLGQAPNTNQKSGVVSAKDLYQRSEAVERVFQKGIAAAKEKKSEEAISIFKEIVDHDPRDFPAWTELGTLYFREEKFSEAEKAYQKGLEQKPDYMVALLNLGKLLLSQKQLDRAIPVLTKAVETELTNVDALHYLGEAYLQNKQGSNAAILFYEALRLAPLEKAELHLRLAWLYNVKGYKDKAATEYKQFLEKVPDYFEKEKLEKYIKENLPK